MRKSFYLLGLSCMLLTAACSSDDAPDGPVVVEKVELRATFEQIKGQDARQWPEGARVSVNAREYALSSGAGTAEAVIGEVDKADRYYAIWPAQEGITLSGDVLNFTLPNEQPYRGEDNPGLFAAACGEQHELTFSPLCGTLTFNFYGAGTIATVGLRADGGELISGPASLRLTPGHAGELEMLEGAENTLFLMSDTGVELLPTPLAFQLSLPAGIYKSGFTLIVLDDSGNQMNLGVPGPVELGRGMDLSYEPMKFDPDWVVKDWMTLRLESTTGPADRPDAKWLKNDGVRINGESFQISSGEGTKEAEVEKVIQTLHFWASYPDADQITYTSGKFRLTLPRTQTYDPAAPYTGPMVAYANESPLNLRYLCGFLRLPLTGEGAIYQLKLNGTGIVGNATADGDENGIGDMRMESVEPGELTIKLPETGIALSSEPVSVYCVLPPGTYSDLKLTATDVDGKTVEVELPGTIAIKRAVAVEAAALDLRFTGTGGEEVDLSAEGTANCYIVPAPGQYSFATRKVSGSEVTGIARVDWIWATRVEGSETNELISDLSYGNGRISFTASTRKGNVLVAAFNDADEILWSWHIWMTDDPRTEEMRYAGGMTFLDRNLGAVNAVPGSANSAGVLYQWGRKDPFAGGDGEEDIYTADTEWTLARKTTVMNGEYEWRINYTESDRTMDYATASPTVMLGDYQGGTWLATADNGLWGAVKTEYDPCPPGYRVPEIDFGVDFTTDYSPQPGVSDMFLSGDTYGIVYTHEGRRHFWPLGGQRWGDMDRGCYTNLNFVGCYWTISFADNGCPLNFNIVDNGMIWHTGDSRWNTCHALSVRCCKE